ncbi:hypothetical protein [Paractinoplanes toevensis]|uniref:Uncharacterized protein n=1 Tax=Paractinoplanes toevensis TaxID=571911 RepID=A0A919WBV4_9ACTN|nr:hypothetical protein [Actinoplanes toevensis]GIM97369.1 hypothetical protein Ato02nite_091620 [Actinoplanes toevensis]
MRAALPASSSLNFLAGIFAGAGINLITSVATGPEAEVSSTKIALDSVLWVAAAACLTWAAQVVQRGERDADVEVQGRLTQEEKEEIRDHLERRSWRRARLPIILTVVFVIGSVALLPRFIPWSALL